MVLQQQGHVFFARRSQEDGPDPTRIIGITGTLAFNAVVLMVLLVPNPLPDTLLSAPERAPEFRWIEPEPLRPPPPPVIAEVVPPPPQPLPRPALPVAVAPVTPGPTPVAVSLAPSLADPGPAVDADPGMTHASPATTAVAPLAGVQLRYASAPAPAYPRDALRRQAEGVVQLEVLVGVDGRPLEVRIHRSSGDRELDQAALRHVRRHWTFEPAMRNGQPVQATGLVPIAFSLERG
ncbi:energy transducer TonB [Luteimonas rhizosphaerae]|nr:energy transducer TonB [Luteimonas sp. 4-12]